MRRAFKGIWIPAHIYLHPDLNAEEKILLAEIESLSLYGDGCYAKNEYLAEFLRTSVPSVKRYITHLLGLGLITNAGTKRTGRILMTAQPETRRPRKGSAHSDPKPKSILSRTSDQFAPFHDKDEESMYTSNSSRKKSNSKGIDLTAIPADVLAQARATVKGRRIPGEREGAMFDAMVKEEVARILDEERGEV